MASLRDGFLAAVESYLGRGGGLVFLAAPADCCPGRRSDGPAGCTCWAPVYDVDQQDPRRIRHGEAPDVRDRMCGDCAYRPGSPERQGDESMGADAQFLEQLAASGTRFWCHDGMRKPTAWQHPAGMRIPAASDRDGDYQPLIANGVPYRADGRPGLLCAGWAARRRALTASPDRDES